MHFAGKWGRGLLAALLCSLVIVACNGRTQTVEVNLVAFAAPALALQKIIPKFEQDWLAETGQAVRFNQSYGASGSQTRAIIDGLEADIAYLGIPIDTYRLQQEGLVESGWEERFPSVTRSVIVFAVRPGNPKNIRTWADLAKPGVEVITANPKTSGVARWNFLGLWGAVMATGASPEQALDYVSRVYSNVLILPKNAREATDIFIKRRQGDVLLNYENELILAQQQGQEGTFIIPSPNLVIDNPIAVIDKNVDRRGTRKVAEAFIRYLYSEESQREFAKVGFRSHLPQIQQEFAQQFPPIDRLLTIKDFGGWGQVQQEFFSEGAVFDRVLSAIGRNS
ncbi:MAG: sulfate ABC transporter substrate-binding protein [Cyanobacteria bacterium M5B4]|nr:MAG: sulfate ABC transporter substrate-binding protein [Cyanobacteria bacterium M5B4]